MVKPLLEVRRETLERRKAVFIEQHSAANDQLTQTLGHADRVIIERQIKDLEEEIEKIERELLELGEVRPTRPRGEARHIMCDRSLQIKQFRSFFMPSNHSHPGCPHVYLVHGDAGQCHNSFVRRLELERIKPYAESSKGLQLGAVKHLKFTPEFLNNLAEFQQDIQLGLFEEISPNYDPTRTSALDLRAHGELKKFSHVIIEHIWEVTDPPDILQDAVRWYLETYWAGAEADVDKPQILIFLNFVYLNSGPPLLKQFWSSTDPMKERFKNFLQELGDRVSSLYPCLLFEELGHPDQKEICKTLNELGFHEEEECPDWLKKLYKKKRGKVKMADIEKQLKGPKSGQMPAGWFWRFWPT